MDGTAVAATARIIDDAHLDGTVLHSRAVDVGELATAYLVQESLTARRMARGARQVGWKLGYTSEVMRRQMGVDQPNHGPLLSTMTVDDGAAARGLTQPRVEPEIALVVARSPLPGSGIDEVLGCCARAHAALEIVDSVWAGYDFDVEHNTADGSSAAGVVIGPELPLDVLGDIEVGLLAGGTAVGRGRGSDAAGHPVLALAWLVEALLDHPRGLLPGDVVITGGLTAAVPLDPGGFVQATFDHPLISTVTVGVRR